MSAATSGFTQAAAGNPDIAALIRATGSCSAVVALSAVIARLDRAIQYSAAVVIESRRL